MLAIADHRSPTIQQPAIADEDPENADGLCPGTELPFGTPDVLHYSAIGPYDHAAKQRLVPPAEAGTSDEDLQGSLSHQIQVSHVPL